MCSSYIVAIWKAAGLFNGLKVHATEFTPRDLYELDFVDRNFRSKDPSCQKADPDLPYCQFLGKYRMSFPNFGTIKPYENMNEHCPTIGPDYLRLENC